MKNMGLSELTLVGPPSGLDADESRALAYGAWDVLASRREAESLEQAVEDATLVVGTSGRPAPGAWTPGRLVRELSDRLGPGPLCLVFGPEASGLTNAELALCHARVHVPTDSAQPSLNLAQAVLLIAYEIRRAGLGEPAQQEERATAGQIEAALAGLERGLLGIGYLNPQQPGKILAELRALLARAQPTPREVTLLRGIGRQIEWAASRIARGAGCDG